MSEQERTARVGQNEALFRQLNESIEALNESLAVAAGDDEFSAVCECGDIDCSERVRVSRETYERTREQSAWFIVKPGHEIEAAERVVEEHEDFRIVEKLPGKPRQVAADTDPRTH